MRSLLAVVVVVVGSVLAVCCGSFLMIGSLADPSPSSVVVAPTGTEKRAEPTRTTKEPRPTRTTKKPRPTRTTKSVYYPNCTQLRKDHRSGVPKGHPAYRRALDRDRDGTACEPR